MLQPSNPSATPADKDETRAVESLSQLRVKICSVRLPAATKLVDISVAMEVDGKYTYRTEIVRKKGKTSPIPPVININESFDVLVTSSSKIKLKVLAPTRLFGSSDLGQLQFTIKSIIDEYHASDQVNSNSDATPSYRVKLSLDNSILRLNDVNNSSNGFVEIIFYGSLLKQHGDNRAAQVKTSTLRMCMDS